ncbi:MULTISPECIES: nuclear transport factor 2 family protein [unclassified Sphingobium]|uniref:nuclear transport factor 2 family protein n=2 Tax=Sphingomonadaceae TaxID=41297 RepID=UPI0009E71168|nr:MULTISPECIES: nuclear transport factor 2 family protein [unclassified Sphingobium]MEC6700824.1 nuclear transport factor 2 family protein [Sphingobium sp. SJ10-10]
MMGVELEQKVREFCDAWGDGSDASRPNVEKILSMMAEDAEWQLWVPGGPVVKGKTALRAEIERQMAFATNNKCNEVNILSNDRMVMQERSDTAIIMGRPCPHQMVAIYEFDGAGLISRWREYLDMADLTRKMGIDEAAAGGTEVPA